MAFQLKNYSVARLLLLTTFMSLYSSASAASSGTATYYTVYVPSACYEYADNGVMVAALNEQLFNGGAVCGQYYQVSCVSGTNAGTPNPCKGNGPVTVKIVDKCPAASCQATIDLSQQAFASIADTAAGKINIVYQQV